MSDDDKTRISTNDIYTGVGTQLSGIYELDERIASGGMGEVYRGHNIQTGDHVAIKIVLPEFARDQTILSLFRKEASILNHLSHDAVVRYHVFTIDPRIGRPYLAMEFVDGQSLFDVMRRGPMRGEEVRRLCHRLASGLAAVHQAGAVHRDLSPDNIILPGGRVESAKIIDFGIARSAAVGGETLIGGKFAGKYNYVSPEQLGLYGGEVSEQSDIYSLGLVLAAALRGKPLDMSGSQYEVIEKRRTVPDLSDIDPDFQELIAAMLQPDPRDRPASMAEIARATRGEDVDATLPPASYGPRDRSGLPRAGWTVLAESGPQPSTSAGEKHFVEHVRPAHLSQPRPAPAPAPASTPMPTAPRKSSRMPAVAGGLVTLAVLLGGGLYFSGILAPPPAEEKLKPLTPKPVPKPVVEAPKPVAETPQPDESNPQPPVQPQPEPSKPDNAATIETVNPPALPDAQVKPPVPAENQAPGVPPATEARQPTGQAPVAPPVGKPASPTVQPETTANSQAQAPPVEIKPAQNPTANPPKTSAPSQAGAESKPAQQANPPATEPSATELVEILSKLARPEASSPPASETRLPAQPTSPPPKPAAPPPTASQPTPPTSPSQPTQTAQPQPPVTTRPENTEVAINVPKPAVPPAKPIDEAAQRASWVRDFSGGDCFYASLTSQTASSAAIEGLATAVQPFEQMLNDFRSRFHLEPDINVRLIEQPQCEVTNFLRVLDRNRVESPQLVLDRTSVPDGAPIGGTLVTRGGLISNVMLIDHRGIAFNLDDRIVAQTDKATFNIPIGLGAADKAAGKPLPQIMLVITGPKDIQAAMFSRPTPVSELLPKILEEIGADGSQFSATAKYFQLGG
ncbi:MULTISPECIES: serine/threonine-protein kinase [Mesorhizobium]|uniref:Serine/threonine protein kinase n=2 Tax=Mesorhizobium TaxID=68287 RepID=A0A1A5ILV5_RHILI|nr:MULTISPECIES: serine/threonine-protein kinase [Mesorhizobium]MBE1710994.1 protein kinase [Mesorhizobium japonicum]MBE1715338.1 protein kinase [Mesorhizobium japonicum]MUT21924.1 protein kinase [Mesorhizobium japonicum]MUT27775.1 protein kinase [Mesorhizobium japonicum]OBP78921.1 serine/threonine protein kinase [Mesorhizobium loti]